MSSSRMPSRCCVALSVLPARVNRTVVGVEWGGWVMRQPDENRAMIAEVVDAIAKGELHPVAPFERPLADAGAVFSELLNRKAVGKIVLVP